MRAEGELTALTYRLPPEHSSQEAFAAARTALLKADATPLFWCERRDCGSSSLLANAVFGNAKLYGPDEQQAYLLVRLAAPQENSLVAVYSITRGNRRAYLQPRNSRPMRRWRNCCRARRPCCACSRPTAN